MLPTSGPTSDGAVLWEQKISQSTDADGVVSMDILSIHDQPAAAAAVLGSATAAEATVKTDQWGAAQDGQNNAEKKENKSVKEADEGDGKGGNGKEGAASMDDVAGGDEGGDEGGDDDEGGAIEQAEDDPYLNEIARDGDAGGDGTEVEEAGEDSEEQSTEGQSTDALDDAMSDKLDQLDDDLFASLLLEPEDSLFGRRGRHLRGGM
jgi:hypothetical protein